MDTKTTAGHVFVIHGHLEDVTCDAAIIPVDTSFTVESHWLTALGTSPTRPGVWGRRAWARSNESKRFWFVDVTDRNRVADPSVVRDRVRELISEIAHDLRTTRPARSRARTLVTLPLIGTSGGGQNPGVAVRELLALLDASATDLSIDLAVVVPSRRRYDALQWQRRKTANLDQSTQAAVRRLGALASAGELSLMIGAGVSAGAGLPSWSSLLQKMSGKVEEETRSLLTTKQFERLSPLDQAELLNHLLGDGYADAVIEAVGDDPSTNRRPSLGHFLLASYDLLYERAVQSQSDLHEDAARVPAALPYERPGAGQPWILKLHGDINHRDDIVLSRRSFVSYDSNRRAAGSLFQSMLMTSHVLFVGVSMTDDNVLRLTHEVASLRRESLAPCSASVPMR